ncbi:MAG: RidA family protein [Firmicutes bacterium]|nr:RidA family protein [Bacillota bacterium]
MNKAIISEKAPAAVGPYVHAVEAGNMLFCSGQLGLDPETGEFPEGVEAQTRQSLINLGAVLKEAGYDYKDVVKTLIFIDNMEDFAKMNQVYAEFFDEWKPARSCVEAAKIPKGALVEIECIACK